MFCLFETWSPRSTMSLQYSLLYVWRKTQHYHLQQVSYSKEAGGWSHWPAQEREFPRAPSFQAPPSQPPSTSSLFVGAKHAVLLQTAQVRVYDPDKPDRSMEFRAILDTGSQHSYATQRVNVHNDVRIGRAEDPGI